MQKIITALGNPKINDELKQEKDLYVYENDIQYKEAILDILEKNNNFDFLIIYKNLLGEIKKEELIKKIKKLNNKICNNYSLIYICIYRFKIKTWLEEMKM
jgi:hypothetical protein